MFFPKEGEEQFQMQLLPEDFYQVPTPTLSALKMYKQSKNSLLNQFDNFEKIASLKHI